MNNIQVRHSLGKSITLHLLPGILVGICYYLLVPLVKINGFPSVMALILSGIIALVPFEIGYLLYQKRSEGLKSFKALIPYTKPLKAWQYVVYTMLTIVLLGLAFKLFGFASDLLLPLFQWIPADMFVDMGQLGEYLKSKLILTYALFLVMIVIVLPTVEEVYFRGYLLPRMPLKLKGWTEILHSALFALYHTWTPWLFITRTFGVLPLVYIVKRTQNIYIGILAHCFVNSIDFVIGMMFVMNM